jgi:hypothetical protein
MPDTPKPLVASLVFRVFRGQFCSIHLSGICLFGIAIKVCRNNILRLERISFHEKNYLITDVTQLAFRRQRRLTI